ncbi:MAG: hypothetical protein COA36_13615 [Desulfotalea sp.]|nr:MAG: hypothetical protein COA36_13615 [Desulfotalea sp.]
MHRKPKICLLCIDFLWVVVAKELLNRIFLYLGGGRGQKCFPAVVMEGRYGDWPLENIVGEFSLPRCKKQIDNFQSLS